MGGSVFFILFVLVIFLCFCPKKRQKYKKSILKKRYSNRCKGNTIISTKGNVEIEI